MLDKMQDYSETSIYKILYPEVVNVYHNYMDEDEKIVVLTETDFQNITQRICEERNEDSLDFYIHLTEVEELKNSEDWSDVNNGIENMINKYSKEKARETGI